VLNRLQLPTDVVFLIVLWRLRMKLSLRDLTETLLLRGLVFSHEAIRDWEAKLAPLLTDALRQRRKGKAGRSWYIDETYIIYGWPPALQEFPAAFRRRESVAAIYPACCAARTLLALMSFRGSMPNQSNEFVSSLVLAGLADPGPTYGAITPSVALANRRKAWFCRAQRPLSQEAFLPNSLIWKATATPCPSFRWWNGGRVGRRGQAHSRRRRWPAGPGCVLGMPSSLGVKVPRTT
jgi:hypothetical protein